MEKLQRDSIGVNVTCTTLSNNETSLESTCANDARCNLQMNEQKRWDLCSRLTSLCSVFTKSKKVIDARN